MLLPLSKHKRKLMFLLKKLFCMFLVYGGICRLFSFIHRKSVKILLYHGIINNNLPAALNRDGLHIEANAFEKQIIYLKKHYHILSLNEFIKYLKENKPVPKYSVVITFDDGYKNNYDNLKRIFINHRIPVTIFLVTDYIGASELLWLDRLEMAFFNTRRKSISVLESFGIAKIEWFNTEEKMEKYLLLKNYLKKMPDAKLREILKSMLSELEDVETGSLQGTNDFPYTQLLNQDEITELGRYGVRFGSHTCRHEILTALSENEAEATLQKSFLRLKDYCKDEEIPFAYPNGSFSEGIKKIVAKIGYNCALTTEHGFNSSGSDLFALKRNEIGNRGDIHIFIATLSGVIDFIKSFRVLKEQICIY